MPNKAAQTDRRELLVSMAFSLAFQLPAGRLALDVRQHNEDPT